MIGSEVTCDDMNRTRLMICLFFNFKRMKALIRIKNSLQQEGNPIRASQMEAYLRNQFSFYGVMSIPRKEILKSLKKEWLDGLTPEEKRALVKLLWVEENRECQLLALEWMMNWKSKEFVVSDIAFFEELMTNKSWWDTVDGIAPNLVGKYALAFPEEFELTLSNWRFHESFWIRRACLIFQLLYRKGTNLDLLKSLINDFKDEKEFFIQKAIGWALREYGSVNPTAVLNYVKSTNLKPLSKKEAIRKII